MDSFEIVSFLKCHQQEFSAVVPFDPLLDKLFPFDLSPANNEITEDVFGSLPAFTSFINKKLGDAGARYGIGGYNEYRELYGRSPVFDASGMDEEPRRLHLGTDIWGKDAALVMAPLDGIIHSFAFNNNFGDYGATIILSHSLDGIVFHTLYGHLSLQSISNIAAGDRICRGDVFANLGVPSENGHWPPHLHFQIIHDIKENTGDYPGVCKLSEKEYWLANCPDPDLILQLNRFL